MVLKKLKDYNVKFISPLISILPAEGYIIKEHQQFCECCDFRWTSIKAVIPKSISCVSSFWFLSDAEIILFFLLLYTNIEPNNNQSNAAFIIEKKVFTSCLFLMPFYSDLNCTTAICVKIQT